MIDFRYHLVSLMAVLIALTVGILLGAGPLQGTLGESLTTQVDYLSIKQSELNAENEALKLELTSRNEYISDLGDNYLPKTLEGKKIAIIRAHNANVTDVKDTSAFLSKAGATIVSDVTLNPDWFSAEKQTLRDEIAAEMRDKFPTPPAASESTDQILARGLYEVLAHPEKGTANLASLLTAKSTPLINVSEPPTESADAIVMIFNRGHALQKEELQAEPDDSLPAPGLISYAKEASTWDIPTVFVGEAIENTDEITVIRNAEIPLATVDRVGRTMALFSTPLAVAHSLNGTPLAVGFDTGATVRVPTVIRKEATPEPSPSMSDPASDKTQ